MTDNSTPRERIIQLEVENIKRVRALGFRCHKNMNVIAGKNGNGKSSTLDSIIIALGGKGKTPPRPVRDGENNALIRIVTDSLIITKHWTNPDTPYLKVETKGGAKVSNPQGYLNSIVGDLSFDPMEFTLQDKKQRSETLKRIAGLDFTDLESEYEKLFSERTIINREIKNISGELAAMEKLDLIEIEPIDEIQRKRTEDDNFNKEQDELDRSILLNESNLKSQESLLEEYEKKIIQCKEAIYSIKTRIAELSLKKHTKKDLSQYDIAIKEHSSKVLHNSKAQSYRDSESKLIAKNAESEQMTARLEAIKVEKESRISNAKMPIDGLNFQNGDVTYNGIPFEQLCSAEQIKVSFAMSAAMNPVLNIAIIKNGSLLDEDSMNAINEMAEEFDVQVFMETVANSPDGNCIFIHDGAILKSEVESGD